MSDVKRWQFTLRGILGYTTLVAVTLGMWSLDFRWASDFVGTLVVYLGILSAGGVVGATFGWMISGKPDGFLIGYALGVLPSLLIIVLAIF